MYHSCVIQPFYATKATYWEPRNVIQSRHKKLFNFKQKLPEVHISYKYKNYRIDQSEFLVHGV
jgi:hypothetical protein